MREDELRPELRAHYEKYKILTEGYDSISLGYLASAVNLPESQVIRELSFLIINSLFPAGTYINYQTRALILRTPKKQESPKPKEPVKKAKNPPKEQKAVPTPWQPKKFPRAVQLSCGLICLAAACALAALEVDTLVLQSFSVFTLASAWEFIKAGFFAAMGTIFLVLNARGRKRDRRYLRYLKLLRNKKSLPLTSLAAAGQVSMNTVYKDIQKMLDNSILGPEAYIDPETGTLCLTADADPKAHIPRTGEDSTAKNANNQYYEIICEIRQLNEDILDIPVSDRIDEIENLTAKIFRVVEENPDKEPQIKSFMSYYLPTTLKLLRTYSSLERQGIEGDNIDAAKEDIERILDTLVKGFAGQLDRLFQNEVIDISTDIEVLETMMKRDDLTGESGISI